MTFKIVAIDVDDTLLNSKGEILDSTKVVIKKTLEKGIKVVLCTGRPLVGVSNFLRELEIDGLDQYVITFNGAVIESVSGEIVSKLVLNNTDYRGLVSFADQHNLPYNVLDDDGNIYTSNLDVNRITVIQAWENQAGVLVRTPDQLSDDFSIVKGIFVGEDAELDQMEDKVHATFDEKFYVVRAAKNFLEVMHKDVNKGRALKKLTEKLNVKPDEVIVFGDELNDLPMFEFAGMAVAMGNGSEFIKSHADFITNSNDKDGIAVAMNKFVL